MRQIGESTNGIRETSKLGGIGLISLFPVGVFTLFNCGLVIIQDVSIVPLPQIGESTNGVQEISKLGGTGFTWLSPIGAFTVVSRLSTHPFKYASQLSTHFLAKNLGFKI